MKDIKRISVVGLGAIGGAYASRLYNENPEALRVIANRERISRYKKQGFIINDKKYDFNYISPEEKTEPADLIIVAVKYHQLNQAIEDMRNQVGPDTTIISLMNGINSEEIIGKEYGMDKLLYGLCVAIDGVREGNKIQYTNIGKIIFGDKKNLEYTPRIKAIKVLFDNANIPCEIPEDMMRALWWKFMINVGINQVSAILKAPYGVFHNIKEARELMEAAMYEVIDLSKKIEVNLEQKDIQKFIDLMMTLSPDGKTSMHQDIEAGRKTEVEMFAGVVCELGKKHGVATPINENLFKMIKTLEQMNK